MKTKIIFLFLVCCSVTNVFGQCINTTTDDLTGITTQKTKTVKLANIIKPTYHITLISIDSAEYFELSVVASNMFAFDEGYLFMLKFADTLFSLTTYSNATSTLNAYGNSTLYKSRLLFIADEYLIKHLSEWDLNKFRIYTADSFLEDEIPMQEAVEIRNITKCFIRRNEK